MNWDRIEGNWKQFKGNVKEQWGKLTDDQLDVIAGKRDQLTGKIQESYGISKEETGSRSPTGRTGRRTSDPSNASARDRGVAVAGRMLAVLARSVSG